MKITEALQDILVDEITASALYGVFSAVLANDDVNKLADKFKDESADEAKHAREIEDRLAFLEEMPTIGIAKEKTVRDPVEMVAVTKRLEKGAVEKYNKLFTLAVEQGDSVTAELARAHAADEEAHLNWAEGQERLIEQLGDGLWLHGWL